MNKAEIVEITEEVTIEQDGEKIILEAGDKIQLLGEDFFDAMDSQYIKAREDLIDALTDANNHTGAELIDAILDGNVRKAESLFKRWVKRETQGGLSPSDY